MRDPRVCVVAALMLLVTGCSSGVLAQEPEPAEQQPPAAVESAEPAAEQTSEPIEETEDAAPAAADDSCGWDAPAVRPGADAAPSGQAGDLLDAVLGSWQHTHYDEGSGFTPVEADIRYVFASSSEILYCQDVPGVTDQAENRAPIEWDGQQIMLQGTTPSFIVTDWSSEAMLWHNPTDGSTYLLQRR